MNRSTSRNSLTSRLNVGGEERRGVVTAALSVLGALLLTYLIVAGEIRAAVALTAGASLVALATVRIRAAIFLGVAYLFFVGDLRRLLIPVAGWSGQDPLLLVGPVFAIALFGYAWASGSVRLDTPLARWMIALIAVMLLQIFNPRQGGLIVGVAGALFYLIPLMWFWIGRTYATTAFMKTLLYKVVVPLAALAALMGLYQTFYGYLPYQETWYDIAGYVALGSKGIQAPISFFSSSVEYAVFLVMAIVVLWAGVLRGRTVALLGIPVLFVAVFLTGIRGPVVKVIFVMAAMWAVLGRAKSTWILRGALALLIGIAGLVGGVSQLGDVGGNARVQHRVERQMKGITGATEESSSARGHLGMILYGLERGVTQPLGYGLGATTKAAGKFGGNARGSEADISDVFLSTGVVGGALYLIIVFLALLSAVRYWGTTRSMLALALLGVLGITLLGWLRGGRYAVSPLIWLLIGALDRFQNMESEQSR